MKDEKPHIETTREDVERVPAPRFYTRREEPNIHESPQFEKNTYFNTINDPELTFGKIGDNGIEVQVFRDETFNNTIEEDLVTSSGIQIWLGDIDIYKAKYFQENPNAINKTYYDENYFYLSPHQRHVVLFTRRKNKVLFGHKIRNNLGISTKPNNYYEIKSNIQTVAPLNPNTFKPFLTFEIYCGSFVVEELEEKREKTVLSILSALGGGFGLGMAVYSFCFGASQIGPWGWVQELPGVRHSLKVKLRDRFKGHIPLIDGSPNVAAENNDDDNGELGVEPKLSSDSSRIRHLEIRSAALELLLKEYVVDIGDFEDLTTTQNQEN
ncbi:hypothetical protein G9A89_005660 [Geosiphon pyriformis]|nr:hypothetical protein G9A89_005660 [Geosiphon pyriformis]